MWWKQGNCEILCRKSELQLQPPWLNISKQKKTSSLCVSIRFLLFPSSHTKLIDLFNFSLVSRSVRHYPPRLWWRMLSFLFFLVLVTFLIGFVNYHPTGHLAWKRAGPWCEGDAGVLSILESAHPLSMKTSLFRLLILLLIFRKGYRLRQQQRHQVSTSVQAKVWQAWDPGLGGECWFPFADRLVFIAFLSTTLILTHIFCLMERSDDVCRRRFLDPLMHRPSTFPRSWSSPRTRRCLWLERKGWRMSFTAKVSLHAEDLSVVSYVLTWPAGRIESSSCV